MSKKPEALVVDDHRMVCEAVGSLVQKSDSILNVHVACSASEALNLLRTKHIGVALIDARMPGTSGIELMKTILHEFKAVRIIGMTGLDADDTVMDMLRAPVHGILLKRNTNEGEIHRCLQEVLNGGSYYTADVQDKINRQHYKLIEPARTTLTKREKEILIAISQGKSTKEIGEHLGLKISTVEDYRKLILRKTKAKNTSELMAFAYRN